VSLLWLRRYYAALVIALAVYFAVLPGQRIVAVGLIGGLSTLAVLYGVTARDSPRRPAWLVIGVAMVALTVAFVLQASTGGLDRTTNRPVLPAVLYLLFYLVLAVGLLWLGRPRTPSRDVTTILDTMAITLGIGFLSWELVVRPQIEDLDLSVAGQTTAVATWTGYLLVLSGAVRLVVSWRPSLAQVVLVLATLAFLTASFRYGVSRVNGTPPDVEFVAAGLFAFFALMGAAALVPSMTSVASARFGQHHFGPLRLCILAVALLVAPSALLVEAAARSVRASVAIAVLSAAVGGIVLLRLVLSLRDYRRRAARGQAVLSATRASVVATRREEIQMAVETAFRRMLPPGSVFAVELDEHTALAAEPREKLRGGSRPDGTGELRIPLEMPHDAAALARRSFVFTAAPAALYEAEDALRVLGTQAGSALARIDLTHQLRAEERERYFRTLVLASTDVILISRGGRIHYSTPSAFGMFGRDVNGKLFDDLVEFSDGGRPGPVDLDGATEGRIRRSYGAEVLVQIRRRDLRDDPTVHGEVITLHDVTSEQEFQQALAYRASHDPLTGLANKDSLRQAVKDAQAGFVQPEMQAAIFIDLDDFKMINDTYGHEVGDGVLVAVARRIASSVADSDLAARMGGDEFVIFLAELRDEATARQTADRLADALARPITVAGIDIECGASLGLSIVSTPQDAATLLRRADTALYAAKTDGKGGWREYHEGMVTPGRRTTDLRHWLEAAIRDDTVTLHYQPVVDLATGVPQGFEAFVRLDDAFSTPMQPEELAAITRDNALVSTLDDWLLGRALHDLATLNRDAAGKPCYVTVTVSARQVANVGFAHRVRAHLSANDTPASLLVIGISESVLLSQRRDAWPVLSELRDDGVRMAIDDYGIGNASLSSLRHPLVDMVRIDGSFLADLDSERARLLLDVVVTLPARLGMEGIAKGVDTVAARDVLLSLGCRYGQGALYGSAMPLPDAVQWQRSHPHS
jgi:diguanylate cyclase (GGDEF)-like protein